MIFGLTFLQLVIWIMVVAGCIGILYVVLRQVGVQIPGWFVTIIWIVCAVVVGVIPELAEREILPECHRRGLRK